MAAAIAAFLSTGGTAVAAGGGDGHGGGARASGELIDGGAQATAESASTGGTAHTPPRRRGGSIHCTYYEDGTGDPYDPGGLDPNHDYGLGIQTVRICVDTSTGEEVSFSNIVVRPGGPGAISPQELAELQVKRLAIPEPAVGTSPSLEHDQVVRVPTWLWVRSSWAPMSVTATAAGVSATVTAAPSRVVWDMGDGNTVTCAGPGTPYDPDRPSDEQSTDCSYTYQRTSIGQPGERFPASATMFWTVVFTSSTGAGGSLGEISDTSTFSLRVTQAQALAR